MTERKAISKKLRFEVFTRDKFTCQYCGGTVPDVVLHVDHIHPVVEGGDNDITNLITACFDCNSGKGKRLLSDDTVLTKQRKQLEDLEERREQIELMYEWKKELLDLDDRQTELAIDYILEFTKGTYFTDKEYGKSEIKKAILKYGFSDVLESIKISASQYLIFENNKIKPDSFVEFHSKIIRICSIRASGIKENYYIRGICRKRFNYVDERKCLSMINEASKFGATYDQLKDIAIKSRNWSEWQTEMSLLMSILGADNGER